MQHNQPLISYYPSNDEKFVDPMFVPYQRKLLPLKEGECLHPVNTWKKHGSPALVHSDHIRKGSGMDFLRLHPHDPCPPGFHDVGNGFCTRSHQSGHESNFATEVPNTQQFHDGYSVNPRSFKVSHSDTDTFLNRSVNPNTGKYVVYHEPRPHASSQRYGKVSMRHSYLA